MMNRRSLLILFGLGSLLSFLYWPLDLSILKDPHSTVIKDRTGALLSAQIAKDGQWRFPGIDTVPIHFSQALVTFEDHRFRSHFGVDILAVLRAAKDNLSQRRIVSGASTIPMQLARMSQRNQSRTILQKIKEVLIAIRIDWQYNKEDILRMYASNAPFGGNVVGLQAAAWRYYNKEAKYLSLSQAVTLAVLPNAPSLVTFTKNRDLLRAKRDRLLSSMLDANLITTLDYELAIDEQLMDRVYSLPHHAPHLLELAKAEESIGAIKSSIRGNVQRQINDLVDRKWEILSQNDISNAAILIVDTKTSELIAYTGNVPKTNQERAVDMILADRSSGSILKPFLYAALLDAGLITPHALIRDTPIFIDGFTPSNYNKSYSGAVAADEALSRSLNIPFVLLQQKYGVDKFIRVLKELGISTIDKNSSHYGLSLILGGAEVNLWELTQAYAQMGQTLSGLQPRDLSFNKFIKGSEKNIVFDPSIIWHTFEAMKQVKRPNQFGDWEEFSSSIQMAWKTGTSYGHRDAWAIGVSPEYTIGVWAGNADGEGRDDLIGVSTAGDLLFEAANLVMSKNDWFQQPFDEMTLTAICRETGYLPSPHCLNRDTIWLTKRSLTTAVCPYHESIYTDARGLNRVFRECYTEPIVRRSILQMPALMTKYYSAAHPAQFKLPPLLEACQMFEEHTAHMEIIYPYENEKIFIPRDLNNDRQRVVFQLEHPLVESSVYWYLNGDYLGNTVQFHSQSIDVSPGDYVLTCVDQNGAKLNRRFQIIGEHS